MENKQDGWTRVILIALFVAMFTGSAYWIVWKHLDNLQAEAEYRCTAGPVVAECGEQSK